MSELQRARAVFLSLVVDRALDVGRRYLDALEAALAVRPVVTPVGNLHDLLSDVGQVDDGTSWSVQFVGFSKPDPKSLN